MNKYPLWKYLLLIFVIGGALIYALPNIYPPDPAVQIAGQSGASSLNESVLSRATQALDEAGILYTEVTLADDASSGLVRLESQDDQLLAKDVINRALGSQYVVALNLASNTPEWLSGLGGQPMKLGLDLSGGVHFLLEVDIESVVTSRLEGLESQITDALQGERIRYRNPQINDVGALEIGFRSSEDRTTARGLALEISPDIEMSNFERDGLFFSTFQYSALAIADIEERALLQNLTSLKNRVNELGVSEPLVQRQGKNRIVVELPGIQDTAEAKRILGKTANLEFRLAHDPNTTKPSESFPYRDASVGIGSATLERDLIISGESVSDASTGFDESGRPQVNITLDSAGGDAMNRATRNAIGRAMGVLFIEYKSETTYESDENGEEVAVVTPYVEKNVISLATIQSALAHSFRITGVGSQAEAQELALLLRAGALAAPMTYVEERTVGPSLGAANIAAGVTSIQIGLLLVVLFMLVYYRLFGLIANIALAANLVMLVAVMSMLGATLTLPGIAGIVLTLGMAVDANVLIFSRIREELKRGQPPHTAIKQGYEAAFSTILDANITTLIVAAILYLIGTGPIKGFAVTLFIGILTSMFTAIMGSRALVNLIYGGRKPKKLWI